MMIVHFVITFIIQTFPPHPLINIRLVSFSSLLIEMELGPPVNVGGNTPVPFGATLICTASLGPAIGSWLLASNSPNRPCHLGVCLQLGLALFPLLFHSLSGEGNFLFQPRDQRGSLKAKLIYHVVHGTSVFTELHVPHLAYSV